ALVGREVPCRVRGCEATWLWAKDELASAMQRGETQPPRRMCASCHRFYESTVDREEPCSRRDCTGTWTWSRMSQLEGWIRSGAPAAGPSTAPHGVCAACRQASEAKVDREIVCRLRGCSGTWTWTGRAQVQLSSESNDPDPTPPKRLCLSCEHELRQ